jgi:hypothetical protein
MTQPTGDGYNVNARLNGSRGKQVPHVVVVEVRDAQFLAGICQNSLYRFCWQHPCSRFPPVIALSFSSSSRSSGKSGMVYV